MRSAKGLKNSDSTERSCFAEKRVCQIAGGSLPRNVWQQTILFRDLHGNPKITVVQLVISITYLMPEFKTATISPMYPRILEE